MKYHPRIHPANRSLLRKLPADHPAARLLQIQAEARDVCVGREIDWPHVGIQGIDQSWQSKIDGKRWEFSAFAYIYLSYDLILDTWLELPPNLTEGEQKQLDELPRLFVLLDECEQAVSADLNTAMLPLVVKAKEYLRALQYALRSRCTSSDVRLE